ncbi:MAG: Na+/H+ antiporter subunit E [Candidatus Neomarinimicrobiota bacterium]|nr:MAG: Na+/H+ antiporter subunit E [Candidatus Neomarinimicrobiota bacterium]
MVNKNPSFVGKVGNFLYLFSFLFLLWFVLTNTLNPEELFTGISISIVLSLILSNNYKKLGLPPLGIKRIEYFIMFTLVLLKEIVKANFDVAYRVLHPKLPIKPGIVIIKTELKQDIAKIILANSITLTPGTFTLDIKGNELLIHWINVRSEKKEESTKKIGERFEKYLKVVFA